MSNEQLPKQALLPALLLGGATFTLAVVFAASTLFT